MIWSVIKGICTLEKYVFKLAVYELKDSFGSYKTVKKPNFEWGFNKNQGEAEKKVEGLMPIEEAINILQVPETFTAEEVESRFDKLFKINDPTKGGSFFIQCKVTGAKITLLKHIEAQKSGAEVSPESGSPNPSPSDPDPSAKPPQEDSPK